MREIEPYAIDEVHVDREAKDIDEFTVGREYCVHVRTSRRLFKEEQRQLQMAFHGISQGNKLMNNLQFTSKSIQFWSESDTRAIEFVKRIRDAADELAEATAIVLATAERSLNKLEDDLQQFVSR